MNHGFITAISGLGFHITVQIDKYHTKEDIIPYETLVSHHNKFLIVGMNLLWSLGTGGAGTAYSSANARIGVGDSSDAEDETETGLQGLNTTYKAMDATYPNIATDKVAIFKSTFTALEAQYDWHEFVIENGTTTQSLVRIVDDKGTKGAEVWSIQITLTMANP